MEEEETEQRVIRVGEKTIIIPKCCSEGREDCKHVVQKQRPAKRNKAL
jgi:hypothetical protein